MSYTVKRFGTGGLHIVLSKKKFKEGDPVEVMLSCKGDYGKEFRKANDKIEGAPSWACPEYDIRLKGCAKNDYAEVTKEMCDKCKREVS